MMDDVFFNVPNERACDEVARRLATCLISPLVLTFSGELGTGKTTFIRAMLRALGVQAAIKSPTFSLVESYSYQKMQIHHFDLYRIHDATELEYIGFRDYFSDDSICCIEWPERAGSSLMFVDIHFSLAIHGSGRLMTLRALSATGEMIVSRFVDK